MNKNLLLIIPVAIVLVAGCVDNNGGGGGGTGDGLEIIDFSSDQSEIYSGKTVRIFMEVENQGQSVVDNALLTLIGTIGDTTDYWVSATSLDVDFTDISPADPIRDIPAERKRVDWKLTAPTLNPGQVRNDQFIGRVYYPFKTMATGTIWVYPESEAEAVRNAGGKLETSSFTYTAAPVSMSISMAPNPPIVETGDTEFTIYVKLDNIGGGTIFNSMKWTNYKKVPTLSSTDLNIVKVDVSAPTGLTVTGCSKIYEEMIGNSVTIYCDAETIVPTTKKAFPVTVTVEYGYYKDDELTLKALGK